MGAGAPVNIVVLGLWHLGCVTAACCAEHFDVIGIDPDAKTVADLERAKAPLFEPGLDALIQIGLDSGKLSFTTNAKAALKNADILWVCFDTPVDENDVADVLFVLDKIESSLPEVRPGTVILISSQMPAGTCARLEKKYGDRKLSFACSPENLRLGKSLEIFRNPGRIVAGVRDQSTRDRLQKLFEPFAGSRILWMSPESAEMTKHGTNAFLALSVTFANELANLCEAVAGADAREVERGLRSESRIGANAYVRPGSAFAGGTLARDVVTLSQLAEEHGQGAILIQTILRSNEEHKNWAMRRLETIFPALDQVTIAVLGLTYKPGTDTLRRSSSVELCSRLLKRGSSVHCFDPAVTALPPQLAAAKLFRSLPEALEQADAILIATAWPQIIEADWSHLLRELKKQTVILDPNRLLNLPVGGSLRSVRYFAVGSSGS
jgi:UDPglucose 6-dehydrogenase